MGLKVSLVVAAVADAGEGFTEATAASISAAGGRGLLISWVLYVWVLWYVPLCLWCVIVDAR
jgi:hypothetical protein